MTNPRSVSQEKFEAKYRQIKKSRNIEIALLIGLDVLSAGSTSLVLIDLTQLTGIAIGTALALTSASILFFTLLGLSIVCGIVCGIYMLREAINKRNEELALMDQNYQLNQTWVKTLDECKKRVNELLDKRPDPVLRKMYEKLQQPNANVKDVIAEIKGYLQKTRKELFPEIVRPNKNKEQKTPINYEQYDNNWLSHFIAFFTGAGQVLGISASIIGVTPLTGLLFTPAGIAILAVVLLLAVAVGVAAVYLDYRLRQSQQTHMNDLESEQQEMKTDIEFFKKGLRQVNKYYDVVLLRPDKFPERIESNRQSEEVAETPPPVNSVQAVGFFATDSRQEIDLEVFPSSGPALGK